jgi:hypothetical protein
MVTPYEGGSILVLEEGRTEQFGKQGTYTVMARYAPRDEYVEYHPQAASYPTFGDQLRDEQKCETYFNPFTNETFKVSLEAIAESFKELDFDQTILRIETRFTPDRDGKPLYPSDMVDEMRKRGFSEEKIQELLTWEKQIRGQSNPE